jgi:aspartate/methionine/tyrosine aminotransferase
VVKAAINLQSHATSNVANVSQAAALAAVSGGLDDVAEMRAAFDRRRRKMVELLRAIPGFTCVEPQGAFYCLPVGGRGAGHGSCAGGGRPPAWSWPT